MEIVMPKSDSSSTSLPDGYQRFQVPDSIADTEKVKYVSQQVHAVVEKQIELEKKIGSYKTIIDSYTEEIKSQSNRNVEIIGIFSSIIALLIINVNIIATSDTFLKAIILVISLTCSISIFAILIHSFFNNSSQKMDKRFWIPFTILIIFLLTGIGTEIFDWEILKNLSIEISKTN